MNPHLTDPEDEQFRALFQQATPPLPDDGFSARVIERLPHSRAISVPLPCWAAIGAFVGGAISTIAITWSFDVGSGGPSPAEMFAPLLALLREPAFGVALLVTGLSLGSAWLIIRQHTPSLPFRGFARFGRPLLG